MTRSIATLAGQQFGWLTVVGIGELPNKKRGQLCLCACGEHTVVETTKLVRRYTKSCGCLQKTRAGLSSTAEYRAWRQMIYRCTKPDNKSWPDYGGRGITVCARWHDFKNFHADMGLRPSKRHSLDRINNDGNYEPGNCRWATPIEQLTNTRKNFYIEHKGEHLTLSQWARKLCIHPETLRNRIRRGWTIERAINQSVQAKNHA